MKKILCFVLAVIPIFILSGCLERRTNVKPITKGITFTADLTYYNECYECSVTVKKNGETTMEILSPDTIKGLSFFFSGNDVSVKYSGLEYKYDLTSMPEGIICNELYQILNDADKPDASVILDKDIYFINGNAGKSKYKLILGQTGLPISADVNENGMKIEFKNVTLI